MHENYAKPSQQGMLTLKPMSLYQVEANISSNWTKLVLKNRVRG